MKKLLVIGIIILLLLTTFIPHGISEDQGSGGSFDLDELMQEVLQEYSEHEQITNKTTIPYREYTPSQPFDPSYIDYLPGKVIIGFKPSFHNVSQMESFLGHPITDKMEELNIAAVEVNQSEEDTFIQLVENRSDVYFAERNLVGYSCWEPNDPYWESQWGPQRINCTGAWDYEKGDASILIALIDSGIDFGHEDCPVATINGWDFVNNDNDSSDDMGHGTHCAGIAAATMNNSKGIAGVAQVGILSVKVFKAEPVRWTWENLTKIILGTWATSLWTALGIYYAAQFDNVWVISFSGTFPWPSIPLCAACRYAYSVKKCLNVAASGNRANTSRVWYPAGYSSVIAVGATNQQNERCDEDDWAPGFGSQYGAALELMAPGDYINSTMPSYHVLFNNFTNIDTNQTFSLNYDYMSGTSMATPHVAGVAALYYSKKIHDDPTYQKSRYHRNLCRDKLQKTAKDLPPEEGRDIWTGWGLVQADDMLNKTVVYTEVVGNGSVSFSPNQATYEYGSVVQLTASPSPGWSFVGWSGDLSSAASQESITVDGDKCVTATFTEQGL